MIFERVQGGGKVYDETSFICKQSRLDRNTFVMGQADIFRSKLCQTKVVGNAKIRSSLIENFSVIGCAESPTEIVQSHIVQSRIFGGTVMGAFVADSMIAGQPHIMGDTVQIRNSRVLENAVVEGDAILDGIEISKRMRLRGGFWTRPPRYVDLVTDVANIGVTEGQNGFALIGCKAHKMTDWIKKKTLFLKVGGWSEETGDYLEDLFTRWLDETMPIH